MISEFLRLIELCVDFCQYLDPITDTANSEVLIIIAENFVFGDVQ